jgi:hypothetical protein
MRRALLRNTSRAPPDPPPPGPSRPPGRAPFKFTVGARRPGPRAVAAGRNASRATPPPARASAAARAALAGRRRRGLGPPPPPGTPPPSAAAAGNNAVAPRDRDEVRRRRRVARDPAAAAADAMVTVTVRRSLRTPSSCQRRTDPHAFALSRHPSSIISHLARPAPLLPAYEAATVGAEGRTTSCDRKINLHHQARLVSRVARGCGAMERREGAARGWVRREGAPWSGAALGIDAGPIPIRPQAGQCGAPRPVVRSGLQRPPPPPPTRSRPVPGPAPATADRSRSRRRFATAASVAAACRRVCGQHSFDWLRPHPRRTSRALSCSDRASLYPPSPPLHSLVRPRSVSGHAMAERAARACPAAIASLAAHT